MIDKRGYDLTIDWCLGNKNKGADYLYRTGPGSDERWPMFHLMELSVPMGQSDPQLGDWQGADEHCSNFVWNTRRRRHRERAFPHYG